MKKRILASIFLMFILIGFTSCNLYLGVIAVFKDDAGKYKMTFTESGQYYLDPELFRARYSEVGAYTGDPAAEEGKIELYIYSVNGNPIEYPGTENIYLENGKFRKNTGSGVSKFSRTE